MQLEGVSAAVPDAGAVVGQDLPAGAFVFSNQHPVQVPALSLEKGVVACTLEDAAREHAELLRRFMLAQEAPLGSEKFRQLHAANAQSGVLVFVPAGVTVEKPIVVEHRVGEGAVFPYTLVVAEENSQVTVIERIVSQDESSAGLALGVFDLYASDAARIHYLRTQDLNGSSKSIAIGTTLAERDADVKSLLVNLGGAWSRNEHVSHLNGEGSNSDMLSVSVASGDQEIDQRTFQEHHARNTTSDLLFKNALYDRARSVFGGLIRVDEGAHQTDAYQTCRNLLLSDDAEAHSMPGLEINADQVKCSHGSTSGQIEEEEIFYLRARGISEVQARRLIALGYILDTFEKITDQAILAEATAAVEARFNDFS
jgi:Fe-S cluster assembly protein SufD